MSQLGTDPASKDVHQHEEEESLAKAAVLKKPTGRLGAMTRKINQIQVLLQDSENVDEVRDKLKDLKSVITGFIEACEEVERETQDTKQLEELRVWRSEHHQHATDFYRVAKDWVKAKKITVEPEDSVSQVSSHLSKSTSFTRVSEAKVFAATRKAELLNAMKFLKEEKQLEEEEMTLKSKEIDLKNKKKYLELSKNIAEEEAKIAVLEDFEGSSSSSFATLESDIFQPQAHSTKVKKPVSSTSAQDRCSDGLLAKMIQQQIKSNEILSKQQQKSMLPRRDVKPFDGDPLEYCSFISAFDYIVEEKTESEIDRIYFLQQYTKGKPQQLVKSCLHLPADVGYKRAKILLKERYGDEYRIAEAYLKKLRNWTVVKSENAEEMDNLSIFLTSCLNAMQHISYLSSFNHAENLQCVVNKLPFETKRRWRGRATTIRNGKKGKIPDFSDLVTFVNQEAESLTDPIFGTIATQQVTKGSKMEKTSEKPKAKILTTGTEQVKKQNWKPKCAFCNEEHFIGFCEKFKVHEHEEKIELLKNLRLCFACLKPGHSANKCTKKYKCEICKNVHPTVLHKQNQESRKETIPEKPKDLPGPSVEPKESSSLCCHTGAGTDVSVPIVPVRVKVGASKYVTTYAALDPHSTAAFVSEDLLQKLKVRGKRDTILLTTMEKSASSIQTFAVSGIEVCDLDYNNKIEVSVAYSRKNFPVTRSDIPEVNAIETWSHLKNIPIQRVNAEVGILLGMNTPLAVRPIEVVCGGDDEPFAVRTRLGWTINGPLNQNREKHFKNNAINVSNEITELLKSMYNHDFTEDERASSEFSLEDKKWIQQVEQTTRLVNGHYEIGLPFKSKDLLTCNKNMAIHRAFLLKKKFNKDFKFRDDYVKFMEDMIKKNYASRVKQDSTSLAWYVPHHGVYNPRRPDKIRVVFDCSAQFKSVSLNDTLLQGPDLTNLLIGVLLRFRQEKVAFMCDIEAMFYQVKLPQKDSEMLRFFWWPQGDTDKPLVEYNVNVHLFGATSSPSCSNYALRRTAEDNKAEFSEDVVNTVKKNFYVDDGLKSVPSGDEAIDLIKNLISLCSKGGFRVHKFVTNDLKVLESIPATERAQDSKSLDLEESNTREKVLGLEWNAAMDQLGVSVKIRHQSYTRRNILSIVSSVYDPLGFVGPFVLKAKQLLQEVCRLKIDWDDPLPSDIQESWTVWLQELEELQKFHVDRSFKSPEFGQLKSCQLHHFSDASTHGYGVCSYIRLEDVDGRIECNLVISKSRCAPLKTVTIPRLELTAATLSVKMDDLIRKELEISVDKSYFWTDSTVVLKYIANESRKFQTFVANRIQRIRDSSEPEQWFHIDTKANPADLASRGVRAEFLINCSFWIHGPEIIHKDESSWISSVTFTNVELDMEADPELKKVKVSVMTISEEPIAKIIDHYSNWYKVKTTVAYWLKIKDFLRKKKFTPVTLEDLTVAENLIVRFVQQLEFGKETQLLSNGKHVKVSSSLAKLNPYMKDGIIRVGGRLKNSNLDYGEKHPILIPKKSAITQMLIRAAHQKVGHLGRESVLAELRTRYWIINSNSRVREVLKDCFLCRKYHARVGQQIMADLPKDRVKADQPPFTSVGVDYFGPFLVKSGRKQLKKYGCIFTCLNIRAIHIEIADSLDTDSFLMALRRFIARRGQVKEIRSDNGTNFTAGCKELKMEIQNWNQKKICDALMQKEITWTFNPPHASHFGGVWERQIRTIRQVFTSLLKEQCLTGEVLSTLMCEVESILNGRPLTTVSEDANDLSPLTPNHLLLLKCGPTLPPGIFEPTDHYARRKWRQVQYLSDVFWKRWRKEYLVLLQQRQKWTKKRENFKIGDVVLLVDENSPRNHWQLGRVVEAYADKHGFVRSVKLKTSTSILNRPISKLCMLMSNDTL